MLFRYAKSHQIVLETPYFRLEVALHLLMHVIKKPLLITITHSYFNLTVCLLHTDQVKVWRGWHISVFQKYCELWRDYSWRDQYKNIKWFCTLWSYKMNVISMELSEQCQTLCGVSELALEYYSVTKILMEKLMKWADLWSLLVSTFSCYISWSWRIVF
jgi:hypothetical protein